LDLKKCAHGAGDQLAALLGLRYPDQEASNDCLLLFVAQAEAGVHAGTEAWLRFSVPPEYCKKHEVVAELSQVVGEMVAFLKATDSQLSAASTVG